MNFWASWCPPCVEERRCSSARSSRLRGRGATVLGINIHDATGTRSAFVAATGSPTRACATSTASSPAKYGTTGYPETFVIDRDGRVAALRRGPIDQACRPEVEPLL